ncbi:hypothetical protein [Stenotrophomonas rhizophila]|nr:hypothetical protein [Stenotrophomonas rhizophila]
MATADGVAPAIVDGRKEAMHVRWGRAGDRVDDRYPLILHHDNWL